VLGQARTRLRYARSQDHLFYRSNQRPPQRLLIIWKHLPMEAKPELRLGRLLHTDKGSVRLA
jgi:hypothetical protein